MIADSETSFRRGLEVMDQTEPTQTTGLALLKRLRDEQLTVRLHNAGSLPARVYLSERPDGGSSAFFGTRNLLLTGEASTRQNCLRAPLCDTRSGLRVMAKSLPGRARQPGLPIFGDIGGRRAALEKEILLVSRAE
jgi:hypothetical protein